jgi:diadenosine tetraphosphate (Ap4A) HIT family hydrolase
MSNFDPFQKAWSLYDEGGMEALNTREAPLAVYEADPDLAATLEEQYADEGLRAADLRFMIIPDAQPVAPVHLVVAGRRQVTYENATDPERAAMDVLTDATGKHLRDVMDLSEHGTATIGFGRIPTMHRHVVAREEYAHGLDWRERVPLTTLTDRFAMRERVNFDQTPGRLEEIAARVGTALGRFAR